MEISRHADRHKEQAVLSDEIKVLLDAGTHDSEAINCRETTLEGNHVGRQQLSSVVRESEPKVIPPTACLLRDTCLHASCPRPLLLLVNCLYLQKDWQSQSVLHSHFAVSLSLSLYLVPHVGDVLSKSKLVRWSPFLHATACEAFIHEFYCL